MTRPSTAPTVRARACRWLCARARRADAPSSAAGAVLPLFPGISSIRSGSASTAAMKKNSFWTSGPTVAIVVGVAGSQPASESSWYPLIRSWRTKIPSAMPVILKNRPRSTRRLPRTKSTPKTTASESPMSTPRMASRPFVVNDSAERKKTVSTPSRKTIRNVNRNRPRATERAFSRARIFASDPFISPERLWECRHIQTIMLPTISAEPR